VNYLADTHAFLWFCQDDPQLSAVAKLIFEDPANRIFLSIASCWEISIKTGIGKLHLGEPSAVYIPSALARVRFNLLPISLDHATFVETLPHHHRDPFDRMIVAQSLLELIPVISIDTQLDPYGIQRIW